METNGELNAQPFDIGFVLIFLFFLENKQILSFPVKELILGTFHTDAVEMVSQLSNEESINS
jgi:hypothetical protein